MNEEKIYSTREVAAMKRVSIKTITDWIDAGYLPGSEKKGIAVNSPYEIPQSAIDHFDSLKSKPSS